MQEMIANLAMGFDTATTPMNLLYCFFGVFLGTFVGVLPGIGSLAAISMLMPLTFYVPPDTALIMLAGIYYGTQYGGSTAAILLNLPGTPSSAVVCLDGYPMAKQGRAGVALAMTTFASFIGATFGIIVLTMFAEMLAQVGMSFAAADYFALMLLGLVASSTLAAGSPLKGIAMVLVGILLGQVGTDVQTGLPRYTFGSLSLADGISLVALSMGLFGVSEVISNIAGGGHAGSVYRVTLRSLIPTRKDVRESAAPAARGTMLGSLIGALPGTGTNIASFMAYVVEKRVAKNPKKFGTGAVEGVVAPESANNAAAQTAFVPTMTLGIPGDAVMALLLGVLIMHGIQPGPRLIEAQPTLFWGLIASFWIGNIILVILNLPLIGLWVRLLSVPRQILMPAILVFMCIGVYSVNLNVFDVWVMIAFGVMGFTMIRFGFEPAPLILGFILGPLVEQYLTRALLISGGDPMVFVQRPISAGLLAATAILLIVTVYGSLRRRRKVEP
ncbi:tripartite tricarboxylate transporter permease [Aquamicrobium sp. LC103]|uniref:tripartite tricarboxylate transporter permease n=1 Tax=Aquamicrobium sp. LC103 TaxID=1120658 RepID=UPI00063E9A1E|nr:tripartite tricarboxylate transporter permease [Aquamicrobium sp. LC103]TKT69465.1 tripartite tricarboxylate transporter permease [Aquamicrobium sp. LC103]